MHRAVRGTQGVGEIAVKPSDEDMKYRRRNRWIFTPHTHGEGYKNVSPLAC